MARSLTEDFLVFLDENKFKEKSSFFSRDFGDTAANSIRGKLSRKLGATNGKWIFFFPLFM